MGKIMACKASDVEPGSLRKVTVGSGEIMIANVEGTYFALDDTCTHAGASLSEGRIDGSRVVCGWHGAEFDCASGNLAKFPAKIGNLRSYKVTVESGDVFVEV